MSPALMSLHALADKTEAAASEHLSKFDSATLFQLFEQHARHPLSMTMRAVVAHSDTLGLMAACTIAREMQRRIEHGEEL